MPELKLGVKLDKLSSDGTIAYLKDITGLYADNGTGYGIETALKASLYFIIKVITIETDGLIVTTTYGKTSTLTGYWEFVIPQDSAVMIEVKAVPIFNLANIGTYTDGQLVWDADTQTLATLSDVTSLDAGLTPVVETATTLDQYYSAVRVYDVIQSLTKKALVNLRIKATCKCDDGELNLLVKQIIKLDNYLKAACDAINAGLRKEAARLMFEAVRMIHADKLISTPSSTC